MRNYKPTVKIFRQHPMNDWLSMIRSPKCSWQDRGILLEAIDLYWVGECKGLPSDADELAKMIGCKKKEAESMLEHSTGYEVIEGRIHWEDIDKLYQRAIETRTKSQRAGFASAKSRVNKSSPNNNALGQQTFNQSVISNQESKNISTGGGGESF
jgi:hypothetical protein